MISGVVVRTDGVVVTISGGCVVTGTAGVLRVASVSREKENKTKNLHWIFQRGKTA